MKILIIGFTKIKYMPYLNFYLDNIDMEKSDVHLLYWNRDLKAEDALNNIVLHEFRCKQEDDVPKISKIKSFMKFRKYVLNLLQKNEFDYIIVLHSLPAVLIFDKLIKLYSGKYIFDYRDSTYEAFIPFKKVIGILVKHSKATFVSSDAFRSFFPENEKEKIFTSHNLLTDSLFHRNEKELYGISSDKIRIAFWGFIRHEGINREIIKKISADSRFELHYYGREQQIADNLKKYVNEIGAMNIFFHGEYRPEDRYQFVCNTDLIHNIYKDDNMMLAMGNKYYDGIIFYIPQLCFQGSFMGQKCTKNEIGLECDPYSEQFTQSIYDYISGITKDDFMKSCDKALIDVLQEIECAADIVKNLLTGSA